MFAEFFNLKYADAGYYYILITKLLPKNSYNHEILFIKRLYNTTRKKNLEKLHQLNHPSREKKCIN